MWWVYLLVFFGGVLSGAMLMALMAAPKEPEPHEVHVFCDEEGKTQIMTFPVEDKVIWHKPEDAS
jgi:acyl-coenzyme A synthetase/AMP-(fatty) acid ligase